MFGLKRFRFNFRVQGVSIDPKKKYFALPEGEKPQTVAPEVPVSPVVAPMASAPVVPVLEKDFNDCLEKLTRHFGEPGSIYPLKRVRFVIYRENIKVEIFLMNKETEDGRNLIKFENYLRDSKAELQEYIKIKEESDGLSVKEYYRKKLEFINKILINA